MNESSVPPPVSPPRSPQLAPMPGGSGLGATLEALLKNPGTAVYEFSHGKGVGNLSRNLILVMVAGLALFGLAAVDFTHGIQWWAAPLKLTAGLFLAALLCLPSLYIFSCLGGLEIRFKTVLGLLLSSLALSGLLLAGFTPVLWVFSQSTDSLVFLGAIMITVWCVSLFFGMKLLSGAARALGMKDRIHLRLWIAMFVLVTFQMSCALRPLLGDAATFLPVQKKFFLQHWGDHLRL